jgi:nitrite transporter NirC
MVTMTRLWTTPASEIVSPGENRPKVNAVMLATECSNPAATMFNAYAAHKVEADGLALVCRAILCNWLVCLGIWTAARVTGDGAKCFVMAWILLAFVAAGFEHSVANMTALTLGLFAPGETIAMPGVLHNLAFVTLGNVIGALVFVVAAYGIAARTDAPAVSA